MEVLLLYSSSVCLWLFAEDLLIRYETKKLQLLLLNVKLYLKIVKRNNSGNTQDNYQVFADFINMGDHRHKDSSNHFFKLYNALNTQSRIRPENKTTHLLFVVTTHHSGDSTDVRSCT